ncbi:unnamed protein product [Polarella glacialis]|uniref:SAM-dependent MTase RsmB/NOP-type domain-containing protein n=1 Tax=Polarella glacialis TaxID=89957 RepID=A0A813K8X4_POLGL|nr:unnamed protein product [Polarella glacialis]
MWPVPLCLRLNRASPLAPEALEALRAIIGDRLEPISWMPEKSGWHVVPGGSKSGEDAARALVVRAINRGDFQLQDESSMLPPVTLEVKEHHLVFDMCAAPGSKTLQVLDAMLYDAKGVLPTGGVIANDSNKERAQKIRQRSRFCRKASAALLVTQVDSRKFPALHSRTDQGNFPKVKFDRIVCDVPCSADGQLRKYSHDWDPKHALGVHPVQLEILKRGLELLKPGGRLCYSTCSVNPIEDEAVVCAALAASSGSVRLVAMPADLNSVDWQPGITTWRVPFGGDLVEEFEGQVGLLSSMFPPSTPMEELKLCKRVMPGDGAGFFLALFEKPGKEETAAANAGGEQQSKEWVAHDKSKQRQGKPLFIRKKACEDVAEFFGFSADSKVGERLLIPTFQKDQGRTVSLATPALECLQDHKQLHIINGGMPVGSHPVPGRGLPKGQVTWHPCPEAAELIAHHATCRKVELNAEACRALLKDADRSLSSARLTELGAVLHGCTGGSGAVIFGSNQRWDVGFLSDDGALSAYAGGNLRNIREKLLPYGNELSESGEYEGAAGSGDASGSRLQPQDLSNSDLDRLLADIKEGTPEAAYAAALTALQSVHFPEDQGRNNIRPEPAAQLPGFTVGATNATGSAVQLTKQTRQRGGLTRVLSALAARFAPDHEFSSIQVNKNSLMTLHVDDFDLGKQALVALGSFVGGELYVHGDGVVNLQSRWHHMDGRCPHQVLPWKEGERYSLVYFAPANFGRIAAEDRELLEDLGMKLPASGCSPPAAPGVPRQIRLEKAAQDMKARGILPEPGC